MRPVSPAPGKSVEILLLESPEAFTSALLVRPTLAEQNHIIARDRDESVRRFALRALGRLRRMLRTRNHISSISYLYGGGDADRAVRTRLFVALLPTLKKRGALRVVGPHASSDTMLGYLDALGPRLPLGTRIEARVSPTGWMIMSAAADPAHGPGPFEGRRARTAC
jgi:hypothetical protein